MDTSFSDLPAPASTPSRRLGCDRGTQSIGTSLLRGGAALLLASAARDGFGLPGATARPMAYDGQADLVRPGPTLPLPAAHGRQLQRFFNGGSDDNNQNGHLNADNYNTQGNNGSGYNSIGSGTQPDNSGRRLLQRLTTARPVPKSAAAAAEYAALFEPEPARRALLDSDAPTGFASA